MRISKVLNKIQSKEFTPYFDDSVNNSPVALVRTCERKSPTLQKTIHSLISVGFKEPIIFEDLEKTGTFAPFKKSLYLILEKYNGWILLCEDDVIFCKSTYNILNSIVLSTTQTISLFCSHRQDSFLEFSGWNIAIGDFHGSQAYYVHTDAIKKIIESKRFNNWSRKDRVDKFWCEVCQEIGLDFIIPRPALAQHIGETSTINPSRVLDYSRISTNFSLDF